MSNGQLSSYIDDPSRFQMHQARAEEITLKEDFISVPMPLDDDFGKQRKDGHRLIGSSSVQAMRMDWTNPNSSANSNRPSASMPRIHTWILTVGRPQPGPRVLVLFPSR